ncbi:carboxypeptidase-like regulatory domain-containing protein [Paenibacillaceae bacterium WGS1546]|uniref:carboxypeptidase-like regulatory domain-containing protein n=1 Tax=Cohnella sp. WGS1546 TaxID=3366810 RepID=UPI00372D21CB
MKWMIKTGLIALLAASSFAITRPEAHAQTEAPQGKIELEPSTFFVRAWQTDGSHLAAVKGRLVIGERPVANAVLRSGENGRSIRTREDGSFELRVDRSLIAHKTVRVGSVQDATLSGKPIGKAEADKLLSASAEISVYHPIEVDKVKPSATDPDRVEVHARIVSEAGDAISFFRVDKYRIGGRVTDADGSPVKDAIVWIDRDAGEGFAKSTPTDRDGRYELFYWPEEEETNLTVIAGARRYSLPDGKVFVLPRNTSAEISIRLPKEGTTIDDKPPALVCETSKGAMYAGLLAGLDVPPGVDYSVSIPDRDGRFVATVPKDVWEQRPPFFETKLRKFVGQEKVLRAGDALPNGFVLPGAGDPRVVAAFP